MRKGTVKFFNTEKKFGFIIDSDDKKEYYVHAKDLLEQVSQGDTVEYELQEFKRGLQAVGVKKVQ
jgi:cold shock protein